MSTRRKRKLKKKNLFLLIISFLLICLLSINAYSYFENNLDRDFTTTKEEILDKTEEKIEYPIKESFNMVTTGDALIHESIFLQYKTSDGYDFSNVFSMVKDYINKYDVRYINQETVFANESYSGYPRFNTPSAWGDNLINAGFNLVSLATNHSFDRNSSGAIDSINYWKNQTGVGTAGMNLSDEDQNYYIDEVNGITYGFLSYTEHTNGLQVPSDESYLVDVYSKEKAESDILELKDKVDVIIVAMHWGTEYTSEPNANQKQMANELSQMGVNIIVGSHPHWTQPIDYIGDTLVIYSLGNFLSNQLILINDYPYTDSVAVGALVSFDVFKETYEDETFKINTDNVVVELIYNYRDNSTGEYLVIPFSKMNSTYDKNYLSIYEKHKKRFTMYNENIIVNPTN